MRIRRVDFLPMELASYLVPALLFAASGGEPFSATYLLAVLTALLAAHVIGMANSLAGRDVGAVYETTPSEAVYELGLRNVRRQIGITCVAVAVLATSLSAATGHWDILLLVALMLSLGAWCSAGWPRQTGAWRIPAMVLVRIGLPMLLVARGLPADPNWTVLFAPVGPVSLFG